MRGKSDGAGETDAGTEGRPRRIDLSVPQVAGSALAAVVAAKLASSFGVYGTILGAGLISVVATCGGSVLQHFLQHFFKRTGDRIRVKRTADAVGTGGASAPAAALDPVRPSAPGPPGDFTEGTVYRARYTGWRRPVVAAALVFGVAMTGITTYELAVGQDLSGGHSTTVGSAFSGHGKSASESGDAGDPDGSGGSGGPRGGHDGDGSGDAGNSDPGGGDAPASTPSGAPDTSGGSASPDGGSAADGGTASSPSPTPDATGDESSDDSDDSGTSDSGASATAPEPGASSRSGTDGQGQDGPAAP